MNKSILLTFFVVLAGISMLYAQSITIPTTNDNEITFDPTGYGVFPQIKVQSSYRYFWNFGDGHFKLLDHPNLNLLTDPDSAYTYTYGEMGSFKAQLAITQIYSPPSPPDDDVEQSGAPIVTIGSLTQPATDNDVNMYGSSLMIHPVREIRPGYPMTFIVTYDLNACRLSAGTLEWEFIFTYNSFILDPPIGGVPAILEGYNGETLNIAESSFGGGIDKLVINIVRGTPPDPAGDERYSFFLNFDVSNDAEVGQPLEASGTFGEFDPQNMIPPCDRFVLPDVHVAKSYDPNYKLVSKDTITTNPSQMLHYIVHFQNTGAGPTDSIKLVDHLDPRLDPSTLTLTSARMGFQYIPLDSLAAYPNPDNLPSLAYPWTTLNPTPVFNLTESQPAVDSFEWHFQTAVLRGTKEAGYGEDFTEIETTGSIEFDIYTYPFMEYGVVIENEVEIFFDDNPEVVTEPALTIKYCCDQLADSMNKASFDLNQYFDATVYPNLLSYSLTSDSISPNRKPGVAVNTANYRCDYAPMPGGYTGLDVLTIIVCDNNTPPTCDTVDIHICSNTDQRISNYPCDRTSVGIDVSFPMAGIKIYPNPTHDWAIVDYSRLGQRVTSLALFDLHGKKIQDIPIYSAGLSRFSLSSLPQGLYILRVNERWITKLVKQ